MLWLAYWNVEPFGDDWERSARETLFILSGLGCTVTADLVETFKPNYDPERELTNDEINDKLKAFAKEVERAKARE